MCKKCPGRISSITIEMECFFCLFSSNRKSRNDEEDDIEDDLSLEDEEDENVIVNEKMFAQGDYSYSRIMRRMTSSSIHRLKQNRRRKIRKKKLQCKSINSNQFIYLLVFLERIIM